MELDDAKGIPTQEEKPEELLQSRLQQLESQIAAMSENVNRQLAEILAAVQQVNAREHALPETAQAQDAQQVSEPLQAAQTQPLDDRWLMRWVSTVNTAFEAGAAKDVCAAIQAALEQNGQKLTMVDFDNVAEYQQDHKYAVFSQNATGSCFLVDKPGDDHTFAVFPYPASPTWFLMGKLCVKAMYTVYGAEDARAPIIRILKPALLQTTGKINASGYDVLMPLEKGELIAR